MDHEASVKWRREYYQTLQELGTSIYEIDAIGDIENILKAYKRLKEEPTSVRIKNFFGECKTDGRNTLDFIFEVKSSERKGDSYEISVKLHELKGIGPSDDERVYDISYKDIDHSCKDTRYNRHIKRLPGPCIHKLMLRLYAERNLRRYLKRKGFDVIILKTYGRYPRKIMEWYDLLSRDRKIDSIHRREILYMLLKVRK